MTLVVEDGTIVADADSYFSLEQAEEYCSAKGLSFSVSGSPEIVAAAEQAARRASLYVDARFRSRFPGRRVAGRGQSFEWPRLYAADAFPVSENVLYDVYGTAIPSDEVPKEVRWAAIEAAVRELASPGSLTPDVTPSQIVKRASVGSVQVEYAITNPDPVQQRPILGILADLLYPVLLPAQGGSGFAVASRA